MYVLCSEEAINYLKSKDEFLKEAIEFIGEIKRPCNPDVFSSVVHHMIGQQISVAAQKTIWQRLLNLVGEVVPKNILALSDQELQSIGLSFRKVGYIKNFAQRVHTNEFNIEHLSKLSDEEVIKSLVSLAGIGQWTAEMLMIFCLQREDVVSYKDLAIIRGMKRLYGHEEMKKSLFDEYAKRYSPYGTVASLYLWAVAGGALDN